MNQVRDEAEDKERKKREKEEKEALKVLLRDQRRRIRSKCEEFDMNRSQTEDLSLALPLEHVCSLIGSRSAYRDAIYRLFFHDSFHWCNDFPVAITCRRA